MLLGFQKLHVSKWLRISLPAAVPQFAFLHVHWTAGCSSCFLEAICVPRRGLSSKVLCWAESCTAGAPLTGVPAPLGSGSLCCVLAFSAAGMLFTQGAAKVVSTHLSVWFLHSHDFLVVSTTFLLSPLAAVPYRVLLSLSGVGHACPICCLILGDSQEESLEVSLRSCCVPCLCPGLPSVECVFTEGHERLFRSFVSHSSFVLLES